MGFDNYLLSSPREISGSQTSRKYDYQKNWSLLKILELLKKNKDFIALIDYHEDLVIINFDEPLEKLEFYQIKCVKRGN